MKQIIEGKRYDTETAEYITTINNIGMGADSTTDFKFFEGDIYKTPSGAFFICGRGGAMSLFGGDDDAIVPLDTETAMGMIERYSGDTELLERHFAGLISDA
jgi:hypothetical protein